MNKFLYLITVLVLGLMAIFIQGTVLRNILPDYLVPNLILSIVAFLSFYDNSPFGALLAFILGIEFDLYSGNLLLVGPSGGSMVLVYGALASLSQRIYVESPFAIMIVSIVCSLMQTLIFSLLIYEFNTAASQNLSSSLLSAVVTGIATPLVFKILMVVFRVKGSLASRGQSMTSRSRSANA